MLTQLNRFLAILMVSSILVFQAPRRVSAQDTVVSDPITFLQVGQDEISLIGPHDTHSLSFGLPADWTLVGGGEIELLMTVAFNQPVVTDPDVPVVVSGGILTVEFNDYVVSVLSLNQNGPVQVRISIPAEAMQSTRADGRMKLDLLLDSGLSCYLNQLMTVIIHSGSNFTFAHQVTMPDTTLTRFPQPLYQASIVQDSVLFVLPDKPSSAELRSALTVAAGLSNLTSGNVLMDLATVSELTPEKVSANDLILIGKADSIPLLSDLNVPASVVSGKFKDSGQDDGVVQMVNSPWNPANVVLLIGGNNDVGVVRAAQAVSTGVIRPGAVSNVSIVESVQPSPLIPTLAVYQTMADLGYDDYQLSRYGTNTATYSFYLPPGAAISVDSYFELYYTHSSLLDYDRSGIVVNLNNRPIGSARFTEASANTSSSRLRVSIPPSTVVPGNNLLTVYVNLLPLDVCSTPGSQTMWTMLWSDSYLNLPLGNLPAQPALLFGLDTYPAPFTFDSTLADSAFILQRDNPEVWRAALQIAGFLGDRAGGVLVSLEAFYADELPESEKANYNLLIVGQPSKLPIMAELNAILPAPFIDGSDIASQANMQVTFRVPPSSPVGYLQMGASPWNPDKIALIIAGNSSAGILWAQSALLEPVLRSQLAGNFAVIDGTQILTSDTRLLPLSQNPAVLPTSAVSDSGVPSGTAEITPPAPLRPTWILPTLIISIFSILAVIVWLTVVQRRNHRPKAKPKES